VRMQPLGISAASSGLSEQLFLSLAEGLKLPLQHIARQAELAFLVGKGGEDLTQIQTSADVTLHLLDSYLLSLRLYAEPEERFATEQVCVPAVLYDTRQQLARTARQYGVELEMHVQGKYEPVMAHRQALQTALVSLGYSLIEALPSMGATQLRLQLAAHRTKHGIVAGMYCDVEELTPQVLRQGQELYGHARQPLVSVSPGSGAGVFIADAILQAMSSRLRVGRFQKQAGFAVTLPPSQQLALV
jgi:hypothetical protein